MEPMAGELRLDGERLAVRLERRYRATVDEIWDAMTSPDRLARWFAPVSGDLREGGQFVVTFGEGDDNTSHGVVRACQSPRRLEVTWSFGAGADDSVVVAEVTPDGDDVILTIDHRAIPAEQVGYGAGWEAYLRRLEANLADEDMVDWWDVTSSLMPAYREAAAAIRATP